MTTDAQKMLELADQRNGAYERLLKLCITRDNPPRWDDILTLLQERKDTRMNELRVALRTASERPAGEDAPGVVVVSPEEFDRIIDNMENPSEPSESIKRGAELLRKLYASERLAADQSSQDSGAPTASRGSGAINATQPVASPNISSERPAGVGERESVPNPNPWDEADPLADLVARFSAALLAKLRSAEKKYGWGDGWMRDDWQDSCQHQLQEHISKGDPRDVANYCAFIWHHGWASSTPTAPSDVREALRECVSILEMAEQPALVDPDYGEEVEALGNRIGYGALMTSASASWRERLAEEGCPTGGEFVAGPCHATVLALLKRARAALAALPPQETKR